MHGWGRNTSWLPFTEQKQTPQWYWERNHLKRSVPVHSTPIRLPLGNSWPNSILHVQPTLYTGQCDLESFNNPLRKRAARHIVMTGAGLMIRLGLRCFAFVMLSLSDNGDSVTLLSGPIPAISPCPDQPYTASKKLLSPQRLKNGSALLISFSFHRKSTQRHDKTGFFHLSNTSPGPILPNFC